MTNVMLWVSATSSPKPTLHPTYGDQLCASVGGPVGTETRVSLLTAFQQWRAPAGYQGEGEQ